MQHATASIHRHTRARYTLSRIVHLEREPRGAVMSSPIYTGKEIKWKREEWILDQVGNPSFYFGPLYSSFERSGREPGAHTHFRELDQTSLSGFQSTKDSWLRHWLWVRTSFFLWPDQELHDPMCYQLSDWLLGC